MNIRIGSTKYKVNLCNDILLDKDDDVNQLRMGGMCTFDSSIDILKGLDSQSLKQTFIHEVTHAILYEMGDDNWDNEGYVNALSKQIYGFLEDNNIYKLYEKLIN